MAPGIVRRFPHLVLSAALFALPHPATADNWVEVKSPNFWVVSDAGDKRAREVAREFEEIRVVFRTAFTELTDDPRIPILVVAAKNEKSFRELLPQYWEREGPKPAGVFFKGVDKHFVAMRLDAKREQRYRTIYHEYFHLLLNLNVRRLPVWLNEGLAEFWEQTDIRKNRVVMGTPNNNHLRYLTRVSMMPLQTLLSMQSNPHASDPDRVGVFYAQAWALTHMLMVGDETGTRRDGLGRYITLMNDGADPVSAFERVFGDIFELDTNLRRYVTLPRMNGLRMDVEIRVDDKSFARTELTEARALAVRGNFLTSGARPELGLPLLEKALALEPASTIALESMGFYHFNKGNRSEAAEWFARAAEADSTSYLSHYYRARLAESRGAQGVEELREALRQTIELNPDFAAAHADLGRHYASSGIRLDVAYGLARNAVELEPDNAWYWINMGRILLEMEKLDEARTASEEAASVARTEQSRRMVDQFVDAIAHRTSASDVATATSPTRNLDYLTGTGATLRKGDASVEGSFEELRCIGGSSFEFIVTSKETTYILYTNEPGSIQLVVNGESVTKDLNCGPQGVPVRAIYTPDEATDASEIGKVRGEVRRIEFIEAAPRAQ